MIVKAGKLLLTALLLVAVLFTAGCNGGSVVAKEGDTVKVHYTGTLEDGSTFDTSVGREPLEFTLGEGSMISGFEQAVYGMKVGESKTVTIPSEEAYGQYDYGLLVVFSRDELPEGLDPVVGQELPMQTADGRQFTVIVTEVSQETITVDANHPLASKDLTFEIELVEIN